MNEVEYHLRKPIDPVTGLERDQTGDAAKNMRYAWKQGLQELIQAPYPRMGRAVIVGGAPSVANYTEEIKKLAADPDNAIFALNFSHNWLLNHGVIPFGCVLFEIDAEPDEFFATAHPMVLYFICSHCHQKTFDQLKHVNRILWHSLPNSPGEEKVAEELFAGSAQLGGGIGTILRTMSVALCIGYRNFDLFGCDGSFPETSSSTHVDGYKTTNNVETDSLEIYAKHTGTGETRKFKTVGYLSYQVTEFTEYCKQNHHHYALRVHGDKDSLLKFTHQSIYPDQYAKARPI